MSKIELECHANFGPYRSIDPMITKLREPMITKLRELGFKAEIREGGLVSVWRG